jgi:hypothetical protein
MCASPRRAANPLDLRTFTENYHLLPAVEQRLRLGGWTAMHVRRMGDKSVQETRKPLRTLATVPQTAAWGWPDWLCLHPAEDRPLVLELKTEVGKLTEGQVIWLRLWAGAGAEIAVVRPRDVFTKQDALFRRLVEHARCEHGDPPPDDRCVGWCRARREALEAIR